jgi:hypothetical protein
MSVRESLRVAVQAGPRFFITKFQESRIWQRYNKQREMMKGRTQRRFYYIMHDDLTKIMIRRPAYVIESLQPTATGFILSSEEHPSHSTNQQEYVLSGAVNSSRRLWQ